MKTSKASSAVIYLLIFLTLSRATANHEDGNGVLPLSQASSTDPDRMLKYYHVYITNNIPPDGKDVKMHCWSSEDDIGNKTLALNESYFFQFQLNLSRTTKFTCNGVWGLVSTNFMAFYAGRDEGSRCDFHCWWSLRVEGIFFSHDTVNWALEYKW